MPSSTYPNKSLVITTLIGINTFLLTTEVAAQSGFIDPNDVESMNEAGASGPSSDSSVGISKGGIIALGTIVGLVVVIGIGTAILYYIAKKRQIKMREALRRSSRRVVQAIKTPLTATFPRTPKTPKTATTATRPHAQRSGGSGGRSRESERQRDRNDTSAAAAYQKDVIARREQRALALAQAERMKKKMKEEKGLADPEKDAVVDEVLEDEKERQGRDGQKVKGGWSSYFGFGKQ